MVSFSPRKVTQKSRQTDHTAGIFLCLNVKIMLTGCWIFFCEGCGCKVHGCWVLVMTEVTLC